MKNVLLEKEIYYFNRTNSIELVGKTAVIMEFIQRIWLLQDTVIRK